MVLFINIASVGEKRKAGLGPAFFILTLCYFIL